ncbi:hypothetical protein VHEMI02760 [[Torrubiella] hemipterigena]|uniref:Clr5 domain-containing protein n=1 Tax=[Torrubiella] hemipterigena TaxID=1531966 RepID=A0A0A1SWQ8_9HYPO|nr:hypothetical protein VHEMI02760 [[Torrubiella] hemipterigena]
MGDFAGHSLLCETALGQANAAVDDAEPAWNTSSFAASPPSVAFPNQLAFFQHNITTSDNTQNIRASNALAPNAGRPQHSQPSSTTSQDWDGLRPTITLLRREGKARREVLEVLKRDFSFNPNPRHLSYRLKIWGLAGRTRATNTSGILPFSHQPPTQDRAAALLRHGASLPVNGIDGLQLQGGIGVPIVSHNHEVTSGPTNVAYNNSGTPSIAITPALTQQHMPSLFFPLLPTTTGDQLPTTPSRSSEQLSTFESALQIGDGSSGMGIYGDIPGLPSAPFNSVGAENYNTSTTEERDLGASFPYDELREAIDTDDNNRFKCLVRRAIREVDPHHHDQNLAKHAQKALSPLVFSIVKRGNTSLFRFLVTRKMIPPQQIKDLCIITALVNGHRSIVDEIFKRHTPAVLDLDQILHQAEYIRKSYDAHGRRTAEDIFDRVHQQHLKSPNNVSAVHIATALLLGEKIEDIARRSDISVSMANGHTALHILSYQDFGQDSNRVIRVANILLGCGVDVNKRDAAGNTCLHAVASNYDTSWTPTFIEMLIQHHVDVNICNNEGKTAMEIMALNFPLNETTLELRQRLQRMAVSTY